MKRATLLIVAVLALAFGAQLATASTGEVIVSCPTVRFQIHSYGAGLHTTPVPFTYTLDGNIHAGIFDPWTGDGFVKEFPTGFTVLSGKHTVSAELGTHDPFSLPPTEVDCGLPIPTSPGLTPGPKTPPTPGFTPSPGGPVPPIVIVPRGPKKIRPCLGPWLKQPRGRAVKVDSPRVLKRGEFYIDKGSDGKWYSYFMKFRLRDDGTVDAHFLRYCGPRGPLQPPVTGSYTNQAVDPVLLRIAVDYLSNVIPRATDDVLYYGPTIVGGKWKARGTARYGRSKPPRCPRQIPGTPAWKCTRSPGIVTASWEASTHTHIRIDYAAGKFESNANIVVNPVG